MNNTDQARLLQEMAKHGPTSKEGYAKLAQVYLCWQGWMWGRFYIFWKLPDYIDKL